MLTLDPRLPTGAGSAGRRYAPFSHNKGLLIGERINGRRRSPSRRKQARTRSALNGSEGSTTTSKTSHYGVSWKAQTARLQSDLSSSSVGLCSVLHRVNDAVAFASPSASAVVTASPSHLTHHILCQLSDAVSSASILDPNSHLDTFTHIAAITPSTISELQQPLPISVGQMLRPSLPPELQSLSSHQLKPSSHTEIYVPTT